ncbi:hypothetical protein TRIUR3_24996 [Triticum urartu]|uniref:Uncharacterized protein n=1 Tax=Triticum urartu TaxID=4572 RepID=M7ZQG4_TRIUA|nr:hypothetical protein TRIUR3_24996 [Triticum urartu]
MSGTSRCAIVIAQLSDFIKYKKEKKTEKKIPTRISRVGKYAAKTCGVICMLRHSLAKRAIEVRRNGEVAKGLLKSYDSDQGIVIVQVLFVTLGVHPVDLSLQVEFLPCRKVVAVTRADSDTLMATSGILAVDSSGSEDGKQLMFSTCEISEAWEGGPLFDYDGNFVGLNLSLVGERIYFMPRSIIIERLEELLPKKEAKTFRLLAAPNSYQFSPGALKFTADWENSSILSGTIVCKIDQETFNREEFVKINNYSNQTRSSPSQLAPEEITGV